MAHQGVNVPLGRRRSRRGVLRRYDHVEAAPRPDELAAPLQSLGGVEERSPADADLFLRFIRRKAPPPPGQQASRPAGQQASRPAGQRRRRIGLIVRLGLYLTIRS